MAEVGSLSAKLTLDKAAFSSALNGAKGELANFGSTVEGTFSKLGGSISRALQVGVTAGVAAATAAVVGGTKAFMDFEKELQNVGKVSGMSDQELKDFGKTIRTMAIETGTGVTSLEQLAASLSSAGVANKDLAPNLKLANDMMVALGTSSDKTGGFIGALSKAMGLDSNEIKQYGSALNVIENASRATAGYTMDFTEAMIPLGAMFNLDKKALLAFSAVAADAGLQAGETATSIDSAVRIALTDKTGTKKASWAKLLGVDLKTLDKMLNQNVLLTLKKSAEALNKIENSTDRATTATNIWGAYGLKSIGSLAGAVQNFDTYYGQVVDDIATGSNSMTTETERAYGTLANHFSRFKNIINDFGIAIGEVTQGPVREFFMWFEEHAKAMSTALEQALSGDLLGAFKTLGPVIDSAMEGMKKSLASMTSFLSSMLSGINFGEISTKIVNAMADLGPKIIDYLGGALSAIGSLPWADYFNKALDAAERVFGNIGDAIIRQPWGAWASRAMDVLGSAMQTAVRGAIDLGSWILQKLSSFNSGSFVAAGKQFANWVLDGLSVLADLVSKNWASWIAGAIQLTGTIVTALGAFAAGIVTEIGSKVSAKASSIWDGLMSYGSSVKTAAQTFGANLIDAIGMGIASGVNAVFAPITDFINEIARKSNEILGTNFQDISLNVGSGNFYGTSGDVVGSGKELGATIVKPITDAINAYSGPSNKVISQGVGGLDLGQTLGFKNTGDMKGFLTEMGKMGKTFDQAMAAMRQVGFQGINMTESAQRAAWGAGRGQFLGTVSGGASWVQQANGITGAPAGSAYSASGGILDLLNQAKGNSIVPGAYGVTGPVVEGTKVFVTNWPAAFGSGGSGSAMGCAVQSVDYGFGDGTKFTGSITPGGPGIAGVGTMSANTPYANRLEVDTCEIDNFGMTPGKGAELAAAGAWKPIKGAPVSEKLAAEIGYKGDYSNVGNTAMVGSIKTAYDRANKSQIATQNKVNTIWTEGVAQTANTNAQIGTMVGNTMITAAQFGANTQNNSANTWYNGVVATTAATQASGALAGQNILAGATMGGNSINIAGNNLGGILSSGGQSISTGASNLVNATSGLTSATATLQGMMSEQSASLGTLMGSLNATALGLTTMGQYMGIPMGGSFIAGGMGTGGYNGSNGSGMPAGFGTGSFGSSKASWIGTGASASGWGAAASAFTSRFGSGGGAVNTSSLGAGIVSAYRAPSGGSSSLASFSSFKPTVIRKLAEGGMVNRPQMAMIGEAGREAVLPNKLVETILKGTDTGGTQMLYTTINVDGRKLADVVGPAVIKRVQQGAGLKVR